MFCFPSPYALPTVALPSQRSLLPCLRPYVAVCMFQFLRLPSVSQCRRICRYSRVVAKTGHSPSAPILVFVVFCYCSRLFCCRHYTAPRPVFSALLQIVRFAFRLPACLPLQGSFLGRCCSGTPALLALPFLCFLPYGTLQQYVWYPCFEFLHTLYSFGLPRFGCILVGISVGIPETQDRFHGFR